MVSVVHSYVLRGIEGHPVTVRAEVIDRSTDRKDRVHKGLHPETMVRVRYAMKTHGYRVPGNVMVAVEGTDLHDRTIGLDLPVAIAILRATGQAPHVTGENAYVGELSLSGAIRPVRGLYCMAQTAARSGFALVSPAAPGVYPVSDLRRCAEGFAGEKVEGLYHPGPSPVDFADIRGSWESIIEALIEFARTTRPVLLVGPPGCGKSMIARRMVGLLPPPSRDELGSIALALDAAGLRTDLHLPTERPFRAPHYTVSTQGIRGTRNAPGETALAHLGVLLLDDLPNFSLSATEPIREALRTGEVRSVGSVVYPARFRLICTSSPEWEGRAVKLIPELKDAIRIELTSQSIVPGSSPMPSTYELRNTLRRTVPGWGAR